MDGRLKGAARPSARRENAANIQVFQGNFQLEAGRTFPPLIARQDMAQYLHFFGGAAATCV
jgi:hypothetical protein